MPKWTRIAKVVLFHGETCHTREPQQPLRSGAGKDGLYDDVLCVGSGVRSKPREPDVAS